MILALHIDQALPGRKLSASLLMEMLHKSCNSIEQVAYLSLSALTELHPNFFLENTRQASQNLKWRSGKSEMFQFRFS